MVRKQDKGKEKNHDFRDDEVYVCSGHFQTDFTELCRRNELAVIPPVVLRAIPPCDVKPEKVRGRYHAQAQAQAEQELNEKGEPVEPPPKTYTMKDAFECLKPTVQVTMDNPDKQDTVTEVYIRGWKIDTRMMEVFKQCWPLLQRLHTINLWHAGLAGDVISILAGFLPECTSMKNLILDGNWVKEENWHELIEENSPILKLSLRFCLITDKGAEGIGKALGTLEKVNTKLVSLNLSGNKITDKGCEHLARGLRMNRTLLVLSLGNNEIGDTGCSTLAEVLSTYPLNHEEVVERRKQMSQGIVTTTSPKALKSTQKSATKAANKLDRGSPVSRSEKGSPISKSEKGSPKHRKGKDVPEDGKRSRREERLRKRAMKENQLPSPTKGSKNARTSSSAAGGSEGKRDRKREKKAVVQAPPELSAVLKILEKVKQIGDQFWITGNRVLISLNLSRNRITTDGVMAMLKAMHYQDVGFAKKEKYGTGLMRLNLQKNHFPPDNEFMMQLDRIMTPRDPIAKLAAAATSESPSKTEFSSKKKYGGTPVK